MSADMRKSSAERFCVLPGAIGVSAAFLPKDVVVVSTNGQLPDSKATFYAKREFYAARGHSPHRLDPISAP